MFRTILLGAALVAGAAGAQEGRRFDATLKAHAMLPAQSFVAPPADAPEMFDLSGRFTGRGGRRVEAPHALHDPRTGLSRPFPGQALQGISGIRSLGDDRFLALTDNGFGSRANSVDAMLMVHVLRADWDAGRILPERTVFLSDPDRVVPFPIATEATGSRYLTGADFDPESIQRVGDRLWIGDEFGPWLIQADADGVVQQVVAADPGGERLRSPDNALVRSPDPGAEARGVRVMRSGGFEGMALGEDGRTLFPMLEKPVWTGGGPERISGRPVLRILQFDGESAEWADRIRYYPLADPSHAIGEVEVIGGTRALIIERDHNQGDPRAGWTEAPARFKRIYLVDLERADGNGVLEKIAHIDLLAIRDPGEIAPRGTMDGVFAFPFSTIESVDRVDGTAIVVANDNNYPFSVGREEGRADDTEFILLEVGDFLNAE